MIKLIGNKSKGQRSFTFYNAGIALKHLEDLKGNFEIIIKPIAENPTLLQRQKLYCLVNSFRNLSERDGNAFTETESEIWLLSEVAKLSRTNIEALSKEESSLAIERIEQFINQTFV
jgi:hypothetical protein